MNFSNELDMEHEVLEAYNDSPSKKDHVQNVESEEKDEN